MRTLATLLLATLMSSTPTTPTGQPGPMQPSDYTPAGVPTVVSWQLKRLPPPSALYVTADDFIVASAASSVTNELITINVRRLDAHDARTHLEQFVIRPGNNRSVASQVKPLAEGFILSISCQAAVAFTRGQTFLRLGLSNAAIGTSQPGQMLMADYVTTAMAPGFPNGRTLSPSEGPGVPNTYNETPAPLHDISIIVPAGARWRVVSLFGQLQTSATAGTRTVLFQLNEPASLISLWPAIATQGPSLTQSYLWMASGPSFNDGLGRFAQPLPQNLLLSGGISTGGQIQTSTLGLTTGDQWINVVLTVEEWLDNV